MMVAMRVAVPFPLSVNWFGLLEALSSSYRIRGIFFSGDSFRKSNAYIEIRLLLAPPKMELGLEAPSSSYRIRGLFFVGISGDSFRKSNVYIENRLLRAPPNMELAHRIIYRFFFF